jgi:hypothetical protein
MFSDFFMVLPPLGTNYNVNGVLYFSFIHHQSSEKKEPLKKEKKESRYSFFVTSVTSEF